MAIQQVTSVTSTSSMTGDNLCAVFSALSPLSPLSPLKRVRIGRGWGHYRTGSAWRSIETSGDVVTLLTNQMSSNVFTACTYPSEQENNLRGVQLGDSRRIFV